MFFFFKFKNTFIFTLNLFLLCLKTFQQILTNQYAFKSAGHGKPNELKKKLLDFTTAKIRYFKWQPSKSRKFDRV